MSDHYRFDLTGLSLEKCMEIAFQGSRKAVGWTESDMPGGLLRLVLYWVNRDSQGSLPTAMGSFPAPLDAAASVAVVRDWLCQVKYGPEPDIDGDCKKGWRVYNEHYGYVAGRWDAFVAIEPVWLEYGK